ncbi:DNA cytosine methyltransferase [Nostoc sp. CHAB 5824]|nr:DNA cytosine methyltransferase [Nostoc sp. CHAB 5824]
MTIVAPNLGKFFTSCTKRPATSEDIALLQAGDWISEKDCPWSWQFKNSCQDITVGVWEGKEFFIPHHLLMVCTVIEGERIEKFFVSTADEILEDRRTQALNRLSKGHRYWDADSKQFGIFIKAEGYLATLEAETDIFTACPTKLKSSNCWEGLRVRHKKHGFGVIDRWREGKWWVEWDNGCGLEVPDESLIPVIFVGDRFAIMPGVTKEIVVTEISKGKKPYRVSCDGRILYKGVDLDYFRKFKLVGHEPLTRGTDLGFRKGDRIISHYSLTAGKIFWVEQYPHIDASGLLDYQFLLTTTNLLLPADTVSLCDTCSKPVLQADAPIAVILFAGGGGVEAGMVEAGIRPLIAVEFDPKKPKLSSAIADCHERNFGYGCRVERKTVQEISKLRFPVFPRAADFLHASPMCSNFSNAKAGEAIETPEDIDMATAVTEAIRYLKPKFFTLENVKRYRDSQSFKIIAQALEEEGYIWQGQVMTLMDCQARERFIVRAAKGFLPPLPPAIKPVGWYEVIADLIPKMKDSELVPGQKESLEKFLAGSEPTPLLIERTGARGEYRIKPAHLPCNTLLRSVFTDGKGSSRSKFADIWLPDGSVKSLSIQAAARLQGFPDWYEFPPDTATAGSIIGYSVPPKFAAQLFKSLQQPPPIEIQIQLCQESIIQHNWHIQNLETEPRQNKTIIEAIKSDKSAIAAKLERINQLLEELIIYRQLKELVGEDEAKKITLKIIATQNHNQPTSD